MNQKYLQNLVFNQLKSLTIKYKEKDQRIFIIKSSKFFL